MGRKLNKLSDDTCKEMLERDLGLLDKLLSRGPRSSEPASRPREVPARDGRHVRRRRPDDVPASGDARRDIRLHLARAAELLLREHAMRPRPEPNTSRNPWSFKKTVELVIGWGTPEERRALARVEPWQYRNPPDPDDDGLARFLEILTRFAAEQRLDVEACTGQPRRASRRTRRSRDDRQIPPAGRAGAPGGRRGRRGRVERRRGRALQGARGGGEEGRVQAPRGGLHVPARAGPGQARHGARVDDLAPGPTTTFR